MYQPLKFCEEYETRCHQLVYSIWKHYTLSLPKVAALEFAVKTNNDSVTNRLGKEMYEWIKKTIP